MRRQSVRQEREDSEHYSNERSYADFVSLLLPLLRDFIPILLERWSEFADRPTMRSLEEENRRLRDQVDRLEKKVQWLTLFQIVTALFFLFLVILLALQVI
ncbi:MAG: hypothetical protein CVV45_04350 [Spirochaetae bacterium HGW-Spirochaetae-10]|nr:MAG: hypothetical protein CVV45_04350 [Spirochaetae bacterium HGW-Spirochaetae-10]